MKPEMTGEDELLSWLRRHPQLIGGGQLIGDDAAILPESEPWAVTVDTQIEGVHFLSGTEPAIVAERLLSVNLSDLAAMGARPAYAFLALCTPPRFDHRAFFAGWLQAAERYGVTLAGGDLASSRQLTAVLTLLGKKEPGGRWLQRSDARPGEILWLGASVGESAAGAGLAALGARIVRGDALLPKDLEAAPEVREAARQALWRHLRPRPQLELGRWLAGQKCGAALDVSDGVARDLHRLCRESGVGAEIAVGRLPLARNFAALARALDRSEIDLALTGGEDYVLLFTLPEELVPPRELGCRAVGRILAEPGVWRIDRGGERRALSSAGWDHLTATKDEAAPLEGRERG